MRMEIYTPGTYIKLNLLIPAFEIKDTKGNTSNIKEYIAGTFIVWSYQNFMMTAHDPNNPPIQYYLRDTSNGILYATNIVDVHNITTCPRYGYPLVEDYELKAKAYKYDGNNKEFDYVVKKYNVKYPKFKLYEWIKKGEYLVIFPKSESFAIYTEREFNRIFDKCT